MNQGLLGYPALSNVSAPWDLNTARRFDATNTRWWIGQQQNANSTATMTAGTLALMPLRIERPVAIDGMAFEVTANAAASTVTPVVYRAAPTVLELITPLAALDTTTNGFKTTTFPPVLLPAGVVWAGGVALGGNPTCRVQNTNALPGYTIPYRGSASQPQFGNQSMFGITASTTLGSAPMEIDVGALDGQIASAPLLVWMRVAL